MSLLKEKLPIVDMHEDLAWSMISYRRPFASSAASYMLTESSWRRSGLVWAWCSIFTLPEQRNETFFSRFIEAQFEIYNSLLAHYSGWLVPIGQKSDMSLLGEFGGQVGLSIMMEGAEPVQEPFQLESFFTRGVRSFSMTWHESNKYAGGNNGEGGLTDAGRLLINEAARLGMVLDVSHLNKESFWDVIEYRKLHCQNLCLIASHANAAAVCECARNLDDDQLSALREADASVGIVLLNSYLVPGWIDTEYHLKKPLDQIEPEGVDKGTWVATALSDFTFLTGVAYVNRVRFENGEIWEADIKNVLSVLTAIQEGVEAEDILPGSALKSDTEE